MPLPRLASLPLTAALCLCASAAAQLDVASDVSHRIYGGGGGALLHVSTAASATELIVPAGAETGANARYWIVHRYDAASQSYAQVWASPYHDDGDLIVQTHVGDVAVDAGPEVVLVTEAGRVEVWNQASRTRLASFSSGVSYPRAIATCDCDGDGDEDIVVADATSLRALRTDASTIWSLAGTGGNRLTAGQMDNDPSPELAVADGVVVDCATGAVQWQHATPFGVDHAAADVDGDGRLEVIAGPWLSTTVTILDVETQSVRSSFSAPGAFRLAVADVDADPALELVASTSTGQITTYDLATGALEYTIAEPLGSAFALGDLDGDGAVEIAANAARLVVGEPAGGTVDWRSPAIDFGVVGPARGDLDGDGADEVVFATVGSAHLPAYVLVLDADTLAVEHVSAAFETTPLSRPLHVALADIDGDQDLEVFVVDDGLFVFDLAGGALTQLWHHEPAPFDPDFRRVCVGDLDGDGTPEVVLGSSAFVHVIEFGAAAETWRSFYTTGVADLAIADTDGDPAVELHALAQDGNVYVFDGATLAPQAVLQDGITRRTAMHVVEGAAALLVGDELGHMYLYLGGGSSYFSLGPLPMANAPIRSLGYHAALGVFHVVSDDRIALQFGLSPAWRSLPYGFGYGAQVSFDVAGARLFSADRSGVHRFEF